MDALFGVPDLAQQLVTSYVRTLPHHQRAAYERLSPHTVDRVDFLGVHEASASLLADAENTMFRPQTRIAAAWEGVGRCGELAELESKQYWRDQIDSVIKGRGLAHIGHYGALTRPGRAVRLGGRARHAVWRLLEAYSAEFERRDVHDHNDLFTAAVDLVQRHRPDPGWAAALGRSWPAWSCSTRYSTTESALLTTNPTGATGTSVRRPGVSC